MNQRYITRFAREILQVLQMEGVKMAVFLLEGMVKVAVGKDCDIIEKLYGYSGFSRTLRYSGCFDEIVGRTVCFIMEI